MKAYLHKGLFHGYENSIYSKNNMSNTNKQPIIEIRGIGKKYNINHQRGGYIALRDVLANIAKSPFFCLFLRKKLQ